MTNKIEKLLKRKREEVTREKNTKTKTLDVTSTKVELSTKTVNFEKDKNE
jgi:hypothetical protein